MRQPPSLRVLRVLCVSYAFVVILLGFSLYWNIRQAADSSAHGQEMYVIGYRDGGVYVIRQLERARLERELIEDQLAAAGKEKL
jgi:hypothetical protein